MIILMTKDENEELILSSLKVMLNMFETGEFVMKDNFIQTNLSHEDMMFYLDSYVLEEGKKQIAVSGITKES